MKISLVEFISSFVTPERIKEIDKYSGDRSEGKIYPSSAIRIAKDCRHDYYRKKFPFLPECVQHEEHYDSDHDHGAWTERFIFKNGEKFLAVEIEFYGQGDCDNKDIQMYEVKPRQVITTVYDK